MKKKLLFISIVLNFVLIFNLLNQWSRTDAVLAGNFKEINGIIYNTIVNLNKQLYKIDNKNPKDKEKQALIDELKKADKNLRYCNRAMEKWNHLNSNFDFSIYNLNEYIYHLESFADKKGFISDYNKNILRKIEYPIASSLKGESILNSKKAFRLYMPQHIKELYKKIEELSIKGINGLKENEN